VTWTNLTDWGDTHFLDTSSNYQSFQVSTYLRTSNSADGYDWGVDNYGAYAYGFYIPTNCVYLNHFYSSTNPGPCGVGSSVGLWTVTTSPSLISIYHNGSSVTTNGAPSNTTTNNESYLMGNLRNYDGTASQREISFFTIGTGVDATTETSMYNDINAFQQAMGRNVTNAGPFSATDSSPTIAIGGTGSAWNNSGTFIPGTSTIKLTDESSSSKTFAGNGATYYNLWIAPGAGSGSFTISGNNTFNDLKDDGSSGHSILFTAGSTQTLASWSVSGTAGNLITLDSTTTATYTLVKTGDAITDADYLVVQHSIATPYGSWAAGPHSTNNQSITSAGSGWIFNSHSGFHGGGGGSAGGESSNTPNGSHSGGTDSGGGGTSGGETSGNPNGSHSGGTGGGGGGDSGFLYKSRQLFALAFIVDTVTATSFFGNLRKFFS
jgi:hypothetical protein